jgi:putative ABC transport system permease protein
VAGVDRRKAAVWASILWTEAPRSLASHKLRTGLSTLGIGVGVAAVIWVVTIGHAGTERAENELHQLGDGLVWVEAGSRNVAGVRTGTRGTTTLTPEDADALRREMPLLVRVTENVDGRVLVASHQANWTTTYRGVGPQFLEIKNWKMASGSFLTSEHVAHADSVLILGETTRQKLFGAADPVGQSVRVGPIPFLVIGVFAPKGQSGSGQDLDDTVVMPWTTAQKKLRGRFFTWLDDILCSANSPEVVDQAVVEVQALMRQRHRIPVDGEDDFNIRRPDEVIKAGIKASETLALLLLVLASISLVVGGIGITNVMLAAVTARTREIGVRVAVGATSSAIQIQFLGEAALLCLVGSVLGIALAFAGGSLIDGVLGWTAVPTLVSVLVSVGIASLVGTVAGFYPAWLASRLDPAVALATEH